MADATKLLEAELLAAVPESLRSELISAYGEIVRNFRERRWEPTELDGGKLCEIAYTILKGYIDGTYPARAAKPSNMLDACRALEQAGSQYPRSVKIQIPRMLIALYEVRNNRGVGHVGGDVDPNHMDAVCVVEMSKWVMSELVRLFHDVPTELASRTVDALVERTLPVVWKVGDNLRVLDTSLCMRDKTLVLLYHSRGAIGERDLVQWVEHSNPSVYRRDVLKPAHKAKLLEYDVTKKTVEISPKGVTCVEDELLQPGA
jgi:hypothetical protein